MSMNSSGVKEARDTASFVLRIEGYKTNIIIRSASLLPSASALKNTLIPALRKSSDVRAQAGEPASQPCQICLGRAG